MPVDRRAPAHRLRYRFHRYVRPAAARYRRWGLAGDSNATATAPTTVSATSPLTATVLAMMTTTMAATTAMSTTMAVDTAGAGGASSNTGLPPPPPLQEEQVAVEQLQGPHLPLPEPLIVQVQIPGAVQATTTVMPQAADVVDDGGYRAPTWTVTLQLSLTLSADYWNLEQKKTEGRARSRLPDSSSTPNRLARSSGSLYYKYRRSARRNLYLMVKTVGAWSVSIGIESCLYFYEYLHTALFFDSSSWVNTSNYTYQTAGSGKFGEFDGHCAALLLAARPPLITLEKAFKEIFKYDAPGVADRAALGQLGQLPIELIAQIFTPLSIKEALVFGLAHGHLFVIGWQVIRKKICRVVFADDWSDSRIICLGDYASTLPEEYLSDEEKFSLMKSAIKRDRDDEEDEDDGDVSDEAAGEDHDGNSLSLRLAVFKDQTFGLKLEMRRVAATSRELEFYYRCGPWHIEPQRFADSVLVNNTKREYVRAVDGAGRPNAWGLGWGSAGPPLGRGV
ncbi:hypothetical protein PLEOSDRAFT_166760 [Pleurotus ostreatus PC15]|uniref:F-box domain-containing protein n=1 Tax=Pleurotus ostreatus (strain PC15) TaxID=1137138 RepID=A0A067NKS9_PLEO1|nr:hypothetical protein PLEOSDRAFT_166760 [Pleurotus ostreatus PC15]